MRSKRFVSVFVSQSGNKVRGHHKIDTSLMHFSWTSNFGYGQTTNNALDWYDELRSIYNSGLLTMYSPSSPQHCLVVENDRYVRAGDQLSQYGVDTLSVVTASELTFKREQSGLSKMHIKKKTHLIKR